MKTKLKRKLLALPLVFLSSVLISACTNKTPSSGSNTLDSSKQDVNKADGTSSHDPTVKMSSEQKIK